MKVILSRKAFDSTAGGVANPILEDGSLIPMPIPDKQSMIPYESLTIAGQNLGEVSTGITSGRVRADYFAHLDPDLTPGIYSRAPGWRPLFGQVGAAQTVLARAGVGPGDLFLFFGWFRQVTSTGGRLRFASGAPDLHVLWGWMQIDEVIPVEGGEHPDWMKYHPHLTGTRGQGNTVYVARDTLSLGGVDLNLPGAGVFSHFDGRLQLTKPGSSRSLWRLPSWFAPTAARPPLGYHGDLSRWQRDGDHVYLRSAARGQEFVLDTQWYPESIDWVRGLLESGALKRA